MRHPDIALNLRITRMVAAGADDRAIVEALNPHVAATKIELLIAEARKEVEAVQAMTIIQPDRISRIIYDLDMSRWTARKSARAILLSLPRVRWMEREII